MNNSINIFHKNHRNSVVMLLHMFILVAAFSVGSFVAPAGVVDPVRSKELFEKLNSPESSFYDKARACQQAGEFGTADLVPALAKLLVDEKLSDYARSGLENIPGPEAAAALRTALGAVKGEELRGVVNSLGVIRDSKAVPALQKLVADASSGVSTEAMLALGMVADDLSIKFLLSALKSGSVDAASACLIAAQLMLKENKPQVARRLYEAVSVAGVPDKKFKQGCIVGLILSRKSEGTAYLVEQLLSSDAAVRKAARFAAQDFPDDDVKSALAGALDNLSPEGQSLVQLVFQHLYYVDMIPERRFNGWEGDIAKSFRREGDAIVGGNLKQPIPRNEFLTTTREYTNFILRAECKIVGEDCNAGIQFRTQRIPDHHEVKGYQADISTGKDGGHWGKLYDESRRKKILGETLNHAKMVEALKPADWNQYEIRCQGSRIQLFLNGVQTLDYTESDTSIPQSGVIAVQIHSAPPSEAWYRNIKIVELP